MASSSEGVVGELILAGTPIGDLADATPSLRRALVEADVIAAEDTRRLRSLAQRLEVALTARVVSYFDANEVSRASDLVDALLAGKRVVVVTDAGMPTVSDPGFRVVQAAIEAGVRVRVVPGPSAALAALAVSGLPTDRFCFEGFLPRKGGARRKRLAELAAEPRTMVFFEAPHRLDEFLADAAAALGADRPGVVARELTKTYEEVKRATLGELQQWAAGGVRGEITLVIAGAQPSVVTEEHAAEQVNDLVRQGMTFKSAVDQVAAATGIARGVVYEAALALKKAGRS